MANATGVKPPHETLVDWLRSGHKSTGLSLVAKFAPVLALVVLVIIGAITSPQFLSAGNIQAMLLSSAILMIIAIGQTFVIATAGIDLSTSAVAQLSGIVLGLLIVAGANIWIAMLGAVIAGALAGAVNGFVISKMKVSDFIATLGTFSAFTGLALLISHATPIRFFDATLTRISTGTLWVFSYMLLIALAVAVAARLLLFKTGFGTHVLAVGGNRKAADNLGLSFTRVKFAVYIISAVLSAVGGILLAARLGAAEPTAGSDYQLNSIAAAVLGGVSLFGGRANIIGPLVGALVLTGIVNLLTITGVPVYYQPIAVGAVVVLAAFLRRYEE